MTKRYKTPEKLGLTIQQYGALLGVREMFDKGVIKHRKAPTKKGEVIFNLAHWNKPVCASKDKFCGTAACIGGTMNLIMGKDEDDFIAGVEYSEMAIYALFYPDSDTPAVHDDERDWEKFTTKQAVKAIDNFLYTGRPKWKKVLGL